MALNVTPKASSTNSNTKSATITRQEVSIARPTASTSRAEALKARLMNKSPTQPVVPRPMGSTARREEMSKLNKFTAPTQAQPQMTGRIDGQALSDIAPPPSGLAAGQEAVQTPNTVEAPKAPAEANSEPLSPQAASLARKEMQVRKAQRDLKAAQDAWKQDQANYVTKDRITTETLKVLSEAGITPDKLVELQINQASANDPQQALLNRIADLETKLLGITDPENGTLAQRDKAAYQSAVKQIRSDAKLLVDSNPEFETIKSEGQTEEVVKLITAVFDEEGEILDVEEAASLIEAKLTSRLMKQYEKMSKYSKIKAKFGQAAEQSEANTAQLTQQTPRVNTLTNVGASQRPLTARDRAVLKVQDAINQAKRK